MNLFTSDGVAWYVRVSVDGQAKLLILLGNSVGPDAAALFSNRNML